MLGQTATAMASRVNEQQALGLDLSNPAGRGAALFAVGAARSLPAATNARNADGTFVSDVKITITDARQLQASAYKLRPSNDPAAAAGTYELTRLSDNLTRSVVTGETIDGFKLDFSATAPGAGDSFLIEPVGQAAVGMKRVLDQTNGIAAAAPLSASTHVDNKGTATVDSLYAVNQQLDTAKAPMTIKFGDADPLDSTQRQYQITLADGSTLDGIWAAGQAIGNQPGSTPAIALGFELRLNGVPGKGDTITLDPTKFSNVSNGNAKAFLNMSLERFVGQQINADGSTTPGTTINEAYASTISEIGSRVQGATYLSGVSVGVAADAETTRSSQVGVNIDEEASRLMQFQQGYQAAAKVLQAAQTTFDELMRIVSR
jgi:flagellar hook-associated protein 1 FlgK